MGRYIGPTGILKMSVMNSEMLYQIRTEHTITSNRDSLLTELLIGDDLHSTSYNQYQMIEINVQTSIFNVDMLHNQIWGPMGAAAETQTDNI